MQAFIIQNFSADFEDIFKNQQGVQEDSNRCFIYLMYFALFTYKVILILIIDYNFDFHRRLCI